MASVVALPTAESLYSQLGSVMEELANAAVAHICRLVDEGYAVLRLENQALRNKLKELQFSCGAGSEMGRTLRGGRRRRRVTEASRRQQLDLRPRTTSEQEVRLVIATEPVDVEEEMPSLLLIKEEAPEEEEPEGLLGTSLESSADLGPSYRKQFLGTHSIAPAAAIEDHCHMKRTKLDLWECSGTQTVLNTDREKDSDNLELNQGGPEQNPAGCDLPGCDAPCDVRTRASPQGAHFTEPSYSYSADVEADRKTFCSDQQLVPVAVQASEDLKGDIKMEVAKSDDLRCVLQSHTISGHTHTEPYNQGVKTVVIQPEHFGLETCEETDETPSRGTGRKRRTRLSVPPSDCITFNFTESQRAKSPHSMCLKEKCFFCKYCRMGFSFPTEVELHERRHTGEKPFGCELCNKRFSQASYLKVHQRVHTGEKPFRCSQCGKCFGQSGYLTVHQRIHTGEKPFRCSQCGKSFTRSNHLKRHQSVHVGDKLLAITA